MLLIHHLAATKSATAYVKPCADARCGVLIARSWRHAGSCSPLPASVAMPRKTVHVSLPH